MTWMVLNAMPDELDRRILKELYKDARTSWRQVARRLGVSTPTVSNRVRRMEETGLILGYRVQTRLASLEKTVATPERSEWRCATCKGPIRAPARVRNALGAYRGFCCRVCEGVFLERAARVAPTGGSGPAPRRGV